MKKRDEKEERVDLKNLFIGRLVLFIALLLCLSTKDVFAAYWTTPASSSESMHLAGSNLVVNGLPAEAGDEVAVFDSVDNLVGLFTLNAAGQYGDLVVMGDSSLTRNVDEGATAGEELSFRFYDASAAIEYSGETVQLSIPDSGVGPYTPPVSLPLTFAANAFVLLDLTVTAQTGHWNAPSPSSEAMHLAGRSLQIKGVPAEIGDEIAVFDINNTLIGLFVLTNAGQYGDLVIMGDSILTVDVDEGASSGEILSLRVYDTSASIEYEGEMIQLVIPDNSEGPYSPPASLPLTFTSNGFTLLDVNVEESAPVNTPPNAVEDNYTVTKSKTLSVPPPGILGNDTDGENDSLTALLVSFPSNGTLMFYASGSFYYEHDGGDATSDSFVYQANDGTISSNDVTVTIAIHTPGVSIGEPTGNISEEATAATFTVKLTSEPTADVTVNLISSNIGEGTVSPAELIFNSVNWNGNQTVTVTGVDDQAVDGDQTFAITLSTSSTDEDYNTLQDQTVDVTNIDNDQAGLVIGPVNGAISENGDTATFTVQLASIPTTDVVVNLSSSNIEEGTVTPATLSFAAAEWNVPQTVTIKGEDDFVYDGNQLVTITIGPVSSDDQNYAGLPQQNVDLQNQDFGETLGITISEVSGQATEAGGTASFTVRLNSQPVADVIISITSSDPGEGQVTPATITFTPGNWDIPQELTITGQDDLEVDGNQEFSIVIGPVVSDDSDYNEVNPVNKTLSNTDGDVNVPELVPTPSFPADGETGLDTTIEFKWKEAETDITGVVKYHFFICENSDFIGCEPKMNVTSKIMVAGLGTGTGLFFLGIMLVGPVRKQKVFTFLAALVLTSTLIISCGGGGGDDGGGGGGDSTPDNTQTTTDTDSDDSPPATTNDDPPPATDNDDPPPATTNDDPPPATDNDDPPPATVNENSHKEPGLKPGTTYYWKVVAETEAGIAESKVMSFTTK